MRVGLLTGTFDPVHLGHVAMAYAAMRECGLAEVWFLVNPAPGHKAGVTPLADRLAMVRLAVAGEAGLRLGEPGNEGGPAAHRMADFELLMSHYPDREFVFIVGADVLSAMRAWEDYEPALERAHFAVAHRAGAPEVEVDGRLQATKFELTEHEAASSRVIQGELAAGARPGELDPAVLEYVRAHNLYNFKR